MKRPAIFRRTHRYWVMPVQMILLSLAFAGLFAFLVTGVFNAVPLVGLLALAAFVVVSGVTSR
ncbi:hypothetical protein K8F61_17325 [Microbacterium resistens]|uniref:Uncharacterized protein n=1 Tax=Microbacterium resistens TaxID=156977 RepID=A0ABY3RUH2_9MICO|nr:hypothetical protein [Microbacterium resistens]UGS26366.1 hypothetical protein K8F61_17325 [Microbacterium resistens]